MNRTTVHALVTLSLGALAGPATVLAEQAPKAVRIGVLRPAPDDAVFQRNFEPFRQFLQKNGYVEGRNLAIEYRVRAGSAGEMNALAADLVRLNPSAILAIAPAGVQAAAKATRTTPIVAVDLETDPIAAAFALSLARPGGNITGLFMDFPELAGKWLELLREAAPKASRVAVLWDPATGPVLLRAAEAAAGVLRAQLQPLEARRPEDFDGAFRSAVRQRAGALLILTSPVFNSARRQIADLAAKHRLPAIMGFPGFAEDGGLMAYGPHLESMFHQAAGIMLKVLKGTPPGEIPLERPTRFELIINLKTAKALGISFPLSIRARADQVIE